MAKRWWLVNKLGLNWKDKKVLKIWCSFLYFKESVYHVLILPYSNHLDWRTQILSINILPHYQYFIRKSIKFRLHQYKLHTHMLSLYLRIMPIFGKKKYEQFLLMWPNFHSVFFKPNKKLELWEARTVESFSVLYIFLHINMSGCLLNPDTGLISMAECGKKYVDG